MLTIEFESPHRTTCDCCGTESTRLTRYVSEGNDAYAVYYASFVENHHGEVKAVISLGIWWDGGTPEDRVAFPVIIWRGEGNYGVTLVDAAESPWKEVTLLGRMLDRAEALGHPRLREVFHITDHIVLDDREILDFFEGKGGRPPIG